MTDAPAPVARVAKLMATFRPRWALCGGWAIDAWRGSQSRDHGDVDIVVFHDDQGALFEHLAGWRLVAHDAKVSDDTTERWDGRRLELPAHIHTTDEDGFELEVLLNESTGTEWVLSREPRIAVPLRECVRRSGWRVPTVLPGLLAFYKATAYFADASQGHRFEQDEADFRALLPHLPAESHKWLHGTVGMLHPGHPWLASLV